MISSDYRVVTCTKNVRTSSILFKTANINFFGSSVSQRFVSILNINSFAFSKFKALTRYYSYFVSYFAYEM